MSGNGGTHTSTIDLPKHWVKRPCPLDPADCSLTIYQDVLTAGWWIQHGPSREARRWFSELELGDPTSNSVNEWIAECHAHEAPGDTQDD